MQTLNKIGRISLLMAITLFFCYTKAQAQIDPGGDPDVPIDGGLSLLVAAGVGYGAKKLKKKKRLP